MIARLLSFVRTPFQMLIGWSFLPFILLIAFFPLVLYFIANYQLFKKCGKEGWKSLIPGYSNYVFLCEICGLHWGFFIAFLVGLGTTNSSILAFSGILTKVIYGFAFYNLGKRIDRDPAQTGIIGGLFTIIMTIIYGLSHIIYNEFVHVSEAGPIKSK